MYAIVIILLLVYLINNLLTYSFAKICASFSCNFFFIFICIHVFVCCILSWLRGIDSAMVMYSNIYLKTFSFIVVKHQRCINKYVVVCFKLWDVAQAKCVRLMAGHAARVGSLAWNSFILSRYCTCHLPGERCITAFNLKGY